MSLKFSCSSLLEAVKEGHDEVARLLQEKGAVLNLEDAGTYLCKIVADKKIDILRRLLEYGVDPNCQNYDKRTPLHVAAAEGLHLVAMVLIEFGADVLVKDRWGNTPMDEGQRCGSKPIAEILEHAKGKQRVLYARIVKLVTVQFYSVHTVACISFYLATIVPAEEERSYTWIGSLKLGDYSYGDFRDMAFFKLYITSVYFMSITMDTIGYGDIHAVNTGGMIFLIIYVSFNMMLGA